MDGFDPKPDAPETVRDKSKPIATKTPGIRIYEHLPQSGERSETWSLARSVSTGGLPRAADGQARPARRVPYGLGGAAGVASALGFDFNPTVLTAITR